MTEDLWYHALKFLDKYRTDVENYDIAELYQFADRTGILERHRELLSQPFHESQVDMKIMYYELIKMLIDYERRNHPETYDATKTVGKIEGYQELTNKLQRYLNQRFIVDIDKLDKQQGSVTNMFTVNAEMHQKIETLEQSFLQQEQNFISLNKYVEKVESTNKTLLEEISIQSAQLEALKDKDDEITASMKGALADLEGKQQETFGLVWVGQQELEKDCKRVEDTLTNLYNQQKEELEVALNATVEDLSEDIKKIYAEKNDIITRVESDEARICVLEDAGPEITKNLVGELEGRMRDLQGNTNNTIKTLEEKVKVQAVELAQALEESEEKEKEKKEEKEKEAVRTEAAMRDLEGLLAQAEGQDGRLLQLEGGLEAAQRTAEVAGAGVAEVAARVAGQAEAVEGLETELETAKDRLRKNVENVEGINKTILVFESRHIETVERMKEVTVLASSVETYVKSEEQRGGAERARELAALAGRLEELRGEVGAALGRLAGMDEDHGTLLEKMQAVDNHLAGLNSRDGELEAGLATLASRLGARAAALDSETGAVREKVQLLEDAHTMQQAERAGWVETLGSRVTVMEASRQQAEARVREEVDASLGQKMDQLEGVRADLSALEDQLLRTKEFFLETNMSFRQEVEDQEREKAERREQEQTEVGARIAALDGQMEAVGRKVVGLGKEKDKLKVELDKSVKVSFTTINELKADLTAENRTEVATIKEEVATALQETAGKAEEAEGHVDNLRKLNRKLLEQVAAQMAEHGSAQEETVAGLRASNEAFLVAFQAEVEAEVAGLAGRLDTTGLEVAGLAGLTGRVAGLEGLGGRLEGLEGQLDQLGTLAEGTKLHGNQIFELSQTIASLDERHVETVERMKEVALLVGQFEGQTREIGQAFKEDQRKELASIEGQLNTIYTEYERIQAELAAVKAAGGEAEEVRRGLEQVAGRQEEQERRGAEAAEAIGRTEERIGKIIETAGGLMVSDATKTERLAGLEAALGGLESKLSGLEAADLYLQESHRALAERAGEAEGRGKVLEEELTMKVEEQQREVEEKLKVQVVALVQEVGELQQVVERVHRVEEGQAGQDGRLEAVEAELPLVEERVRSLEEETRSLAGGLVSLQFQAEREEAVVTLASRVDRIDEERQQSEARATEEKERAVAENSEQLIALKGRVSSLEETGQEAAGDRRAMAGQLQAVRAECDEQGLALARAAQLERSLEEVRGGVDERLAVLLLQSEEQRVVVERTSSTVATFSQRVDTYQKEVREVADTGVADHEVFRQEVERKLLELFDTTEDHDGRLEQLGSDLAGVMQLASRTLEDVVGTQAELQVLQKCVVEEGELVVRRLGEQQAVAEGLGGRFDRMEAARETEMTELQRSVQRADASAEQSAGLEVRLVLLEAAGREQGGLLLAVERTLTDRLEEVSDLVRDHSASSAGDLRTLRGELAGEAESVWTLVVEIYAALRGSTLVLKSEGVVKEHQADVLGVYRMVDSYNERPVYKQDGGENYIYYSAASCSWLVGAVVGHQHGWLRNSSSEAGAARWVPDLGSGWEYRPLVRGGDSLQTMDSWRTDDGSLRIEPLRDVEKVNELIRDIRNSREVD